MSQFEIIVVANGCTDNTKEWCLQQDDITLLWYDQPMGYTKAANAGMKVAIGDYIIFSNNDVELLPQPINYWLNKCEQPFIDDPTVGVTGALAKYEPELDFTFIIGWNMMISRKLVDTIGYMDEIFSPGSQEDLDYCIRADRAGFKVVEVGDLRWDEQAQTNTGTFPIWHKDNQTFGNVDGYKEIFWRNMDIIKQKHFSGKKQLPDTVLCSITTRGRYHTTLPLALEAVLAQTKKPDHIIIFDDNDQPVDLRDNIIYKFLFSVAERKNITLEVIFGKKKGPHHNHQIANKNKWKWVWRVDDDCIPEPNVLENLLKYVGDDIGGIGGTISTPPHTKDTFDSTGKIENIDTETNVQWKNHKTVVEVDHLHCSFLYRANTVDYNLDLSRVGHREETLFTYELKLAGYKNIVIPDTVTWHMRYDNGGIRETDKYKKELFDHDEIIFKNRLKLEYTTVVVLDCGMGDHIVFKRVLPDIKNPIIFSCYPEIIPGRPIAEAEMLYGDLDSFNVYRQMDNWNWTGTLEDAFRKMYVK